jgi:hypothetical protein
VQSPKYQPLTVAQNVPFADIQILHKFNSNTAQNLLSAKYKHITRNLNYNALAMHCYGKLTNSVANPRQCTFHALLGISAADALLLSNQMQVPMHVP